MYVSLAVVLILSVSDAILIGGHGPREEPGPNNIPTSDIQYPRDDDVPPCNTDNNLPGLCVDIRLCYAARLAVRAGNQPARCGWVENYIPQVCCHPDQVQQPKVVFRPYFPYYRYRYYQGYRRYRDRRNRYQDRRYGDRPYDDRRYDDERYDDRRYDDRRYDDRRYDDRPYDDRRYDDRRYEDRPYEDRPYEDRRYEDRPYEDRRYEDRPYEDRRYKRDDVDA